jgi:hypothetical protein
MSVKASRKKNALRIKDAEFIDAEFIDETLARLK